MLQVDLHVHTLFSLCGLHTLLEILTEAKRLGIKAVAITDHALTLGGRLNSVFYERFQSPFPEVKVIKGIECNLLDDKGNVDIPWSYYKYLEIILLGIHPNTPRGLSCQENTEMLIRAIQQNPVIDIITHPNDPVYKNDLITLAEFAKNSGIALEMNNSKVLYARSSVQDAIDLLEACKKVKCPIVITSDTHAIHELGRDDSVKPLLEQTGFPEDLIINSNLQKANSWLEERRSVKKSWVPPSLKK